MKMLNEITIRKSFYGASILCAMILMLTSHTASAAEFKGTDNEGRSCRADFAGAYKSSDLSIVSVGKVSLNIIGSEELNLDNVTNESHGLNTKDSTTIILNDSTSVAIGFSKQSFESENSPISPAFFEISSNSDVKLRCNF